MSHNIDIGIVAGLRKPATGSHLPNYLQRTLSLTQVVLDKSDTTLERLETVSDALSDATVGSMRSLASTSSSSSQLNSPRPSCPVRVGFRSSRGSHSFRRPFDYTSNNLHSPGSIFEQSGPVDGDQKCRQPSARNTWTCAQLWDCKAVFLPSTGLQKTRCGLCGQYFGQSMLLNVYMCRTAEARLDGNCDGDTLAFSRLDDFWRDTYCEHDAITDLCLFDTVQERSWRDDKPVIDRVFDTDNLDDIKPNIARVAE